MDIKIEELNKKISIVIEMLIDNGNGVDIPTEVVYSTPWAKIANISGTEVFKASADYSKVVTRFIVRFRKDKEYTTEMLIKYKSNTYNIIYVNNYNESSEFIEIVAEVVK